MRAWNNSLTVKLLTNVNFVNFFKKVFWEILLVSYMKSKYCATSVLFRFSAEKSPNKAKTASLIVFFVRIHSKINAVLDHLPASS